MIVWSIVETERRRRGSEHEGLDYLDICTEFFAPLDHVITVLSNDV